MNKQKLQSKEFEALKDRYRVILKWATGCGKSKMTIDLINHAVTSNLSSKKPVKVLFVVAEIAHIQNWQDEFEKWGLRFDRVATDVMCYASLHKVKDKRYDIVVFDEAHHAFTEKRLSIIETISTEYVYMLSATLPSSKIEIAEDIFGKFITSTVTLKNAINNDILPDPRVYVIEMKLNDTIVNQEIRIGKDPNPIPVKWEERGKYIYSGKSCVIQCTEAQKYIFLTNTMEYWKNRYEHSHNQFHHTKWVNTGSQRKRFLGELKTEAVKKLVSTFSRRKRFVCFCASVNQAQELDVENTISSKRPSYLNQRIIKAFNEKKLNRLYAVGMITEGMNLTDIETGVIVQLDGKERLFIQKFGRSLRAEDPVTYIFYYKGTQDETYLKTALENIDSKYVQYI